MENQINKSGEPSVLIVVLNWMKYEDTINCVHSLLKLSYTNYKILIIDNNSLNDSVQKLTSSFPNIQLEISKENNGFAAGNKIGVDYGLKNNFDLVWLLNNDCVVRQDSLFELIEGYKRNGDAIYSNLTLMSENPDIIHYAGTYEIDEELQPELYPTYDKLRGKLLDDYKDSLVEKPARIYGHSMLIPNDIIREFGFMDSKYFMFYEEGDYTRSLLKENILTIFIPKAIITHISSSSLQLSPKMKFIGIYYGARNKVYFDAKFGYKESSIIIQKKGGILGLLKFLIRYKFSTKVKRIEFENDYYTCLGLIHGLLGIRGKTLKPEKLI